MARSLFHAVALALLGAPLAACASNDGSASVGASERAGSVRSPIVGGGLSTTAEDFVLFIGQAGEADRGCGSALIAPNLVVTAKHCVYEFTAGDSFCDGTGEPMIGSTGGYVGDPLPVEKLGFFTGVDAKKKFLDGEVAPAKALKVVDDKSKSLCSHDIAFVVLDKPITSVPLSKVQLAKRPQEGAKIAVSGWGMLDNRESTKTRFVRSDVTIQRVGAPQPIPGSTGTSLGPMTFETGPGACSGDSGSPGFIASTGTTLGVVARALNLDKDDPISPCHPDTVQNVYITIADYPKELREAFGAAKAEPWQEGKAAPGWTRFSEACASDLECEGGLCAKAAGAVTGTCNLDCSKAGATCPAGFVCGAAKTCETAPPPPPPEASTSSGGAAPVAPPVEEPEPEARASGCTTSPKFMHGASSAVAIGACLALVAAARMRRRSRRS